MILFEIFNLNKLVININIICTLLSFIAELTLIIYKKIEKADDESINL
jgi:hypothetical protein